MGNTSTYGDTSTTWAEQPIWIYNSSNSDYYYRVKRKEKKKEFIEENEFKM